MTVKKQEARSFSRVAEKAVGIADEHEEVLLTYQRIGENLESRRPSLQTS